MRNPGPRAGRLSPGDPLALLLTAAAVATAPSFTIHGDHGIAGVVVARSTPAVAAKYGKLASRIYAGAWGESVEAFRVRVTLEDIARGVGVVTRGEAGVADDYVGRIFASSLRNDSGDMDALDADIVIQSAVFGKVIYG